MRDSAKLAADGAIDQRVAMAVDVAPQRGDSVDVDVALSVIEVRAFAVVDHQRRLLVDPPLLLRERDAKGGVDRRRLGRRSYGFMHATLRRGRN